MSNNTSVAAPSIATSLGPLVVMEYETTERFRSIPLHTAVAHPDGRLVAVIGPAHDQESLIYAQLFASSPRLLAACESARYIAEDRSVPPSQRLESIVEVIEAAITEARGQEA